jgi:hypothetical protein
VPTETQCVPKNILEKLPSSALVGEGWERRFVADADRADEAVEIYTQLGFDVYVEPVIASELGDGCNECALVATCQFRTIYTRIKALPGREGGVPNEQSDSGSET